MSEATEGDYGSDIDLDEELQGILQRAESGFVGSQNIQLEQSVVVEGMIDMEDMDVIMAEPKLSPSQEFRKKGWLSVSDLVGGIWCEVQVGRT
jgi:exonuclease V